VQLPSIEMEYYAKPLEINELIRKINEELIRKINEELKEP
jgi:hypothetical protein